MRRAVGLFDLSHMGEIEVTRRGGGRLPALRAGQRPGRARDRPGAVLDGLRGRRRHHRRPDRLPPRRRAVLGRLQRRRIARPWSPSSRRSSRAATSGPSLEDRSDRIALIAPQGPNAAALLGELTDLDLAGIGNYRSAPGTRGRHRLPGGAHRLHRRGRLRALLRRPPRDASCGRPLSRRGRAARGRGRAGSARATRCASRRACRSTATS